MRGSLAYRTATLIACHATYPAIGPLTPARIAINRRRGTATHRRLGRTSGGAGRRAPGDCSQVGTRMLVTSGHRRHVTRWPLMTSHEPCHAIARQLLGATRIHGPDSHRLKPLHR